MGFEGYYNGMHYRSPTADTKLQEMTGDQLLAALVSDPTTKKYLDDLGIGGAEKFMGILTQELKQMDPKLTQDAALAKLSENLYARHILNSSYGEGGLSVQIPDNMIAVLRAGAMDGRTVFQKGVEAVTSQPTQFGQSSLVTADQAGQPESAADPKVAADRLGGMSGRAEVAIRGRPAAIEAAANP